MKKLVLGLAMLGLLTSSAHAKKLQLVCHTWLVQHLKRLVAVIIVVKLQCKSCIKKVGSFLVTLVEQVGLF